MNRFLSHHQEIASDFFWRLLQTVSKEGVVFTIFLLAAIMLNPNDFGLYNYSLAGIFLLILFGDFGISAAASRYVAEYSTTNPERLRSVLFNSGIIISLFAGATTVLALLVGPSILGDKFKFILVLLPLVFLAPMTSLYDGIYRGLKRFKILSLISIAVGLLGILAAYFLISTLGLLGAFLAQDLFYFFLFLALAFGYREFHMKFDSHVVREITKYSLVVGVASLSFFIFTRINTLVLGHYNLIIEVGYYEIVTKILAIFIIPFTILAQVISPRVTDLHARKESREILYRFLTYLSSSLAMGVVFALALVVVLPLILKTYLTQYYNFYVLRSLYVLAILLVTQAASTLVSVGFSTPSGRASLNMYFLLFFGLLNVPLSIIFVHAYGYFGIIYSTLIIKGSADITFIAYYLYVLLHE